MMVNQVNNNLVPWQNTVPQQMPWMSSYQAAPLSLQFGQQGLPIGADNMLLPNSHPLLAQQHPSMQNQLDANVVVCAPQLAAQLSQQVSPLITDTALSRGPGMPASHIHETLQPNSSVSNLLNPVVGPQLPIQNISNPILSSTNQGGVFNLGASLTQLPTLLNNDSTIYPHKRSSIEMEDESIKIEEPPTKQLLSERRLFRKFGSLHLDANLGSHQDSNNDSDDSEEDDRSQPTMTTNAIEQDQNSAREEFNRYVYLLFKDKKGNDTAFSPTTTTLDRLAREERDKLSKAVILWNPPPKPNFFGTTNDDGDQEEDEDDEESFSYKDHTDFLKTKFNLNNDDDSIIITEVTCDEPCNSTTSTPATCTDADTEMF